MSIIFRIDNGTVTCSRDRQEKSSRNFRMAAFIIFGLSFLILLSSILGDGGLVRIYQLRRDKRELLTKINDEKGRQEALLEEIKGLKEDPSKLEKIAREELGLVKEGELIFDFRER